ncbi:MAG TPA: bifunctional oligoribonuclease/PAP phosphatase NrnA [Ktedonobacterales bacterium]
MVQFSNDASEGLDSEQVQAAWALMMEAERIALLAHEHPDGDALGAALGLAHVLRGFGKTCVVACADPPPALYAFLPGVTEAQTDLGDEAFDLVVALDAGELSRYGALYERHRAFLDHALVVNIDHHVTSEGCGQVNIIDVASAATAEVITLLLMQVGAAISRDAAICLLTGIITDTRAFEFSATTPRTLEAAAHLMRAGAVPADIVKPVYRINSLPKVRLWGQVLSAVESALDGRLVWSVLTEKMLQKSGATADLEDGLPSYLIDIQGAQIAALFKEHPDGCPRVSLRTVHPYDAAAMAAHFGGGGHVRAAGFAFQGTFDEARRETLAYLEQQLRDAEHKKQK